MILNILKLLVPIVLNWIYAKSIKAQARIKKDAELKQRAQEIADRIKRAKTKEEIHEAVDELRNSF